MVANTACLSFTTDGTAPQWSKFDSNTPFVIQTWSPNKLYRSLLGQDAKLVTILRDPVAQYESMFTYYNLEIRNGEINEYLNR